jgi:hypothetical protein
MGCSADSEVSGFVFTSLDQGTKEFPVKLLGTTGVKQFFFSIPVPGLRVDHAYKRFDEYYDSEETIQCDEIQVKKRLEGFSRSTTNKRGTIEGGSSQFSRDRRFPYYTQRLWREMG